MHLQPFAGVRFRSLVVAAVVAPAALLLAGCTGVASPSSSNTSPAESGPTAVAGRVVLELGDCRVAGAADTVGSDSVVPCSEPHDEEAFYVFDLSGGDFPGDDAIWSIAEANCGAQFEMFVGVEYTASALDWFVDAPDEPAWSMGDRRAVCVVYDPIGSVTGSLAGAVR